ncbi:MAG: hypothetical protein WD851_07880 [Pirellulales bacterium]
MERAIAAVAIEERTRIKARDEEVHPAIIIEVASGSAAGSEEAGSRRIAGMLHVANPSAGGYIRVYDC